VEKARRIDSEGAMPRAAQRKEQTTRNEQLANNAKVYGECSAKLFTVKMRCIGQPSYRGGVAKIKNQVGRSLRLGNPNLATLRLAKCSR
jgi:hypothetical protein